MPMVYLVISGISFEAARDELIMDAAFRARVWLPHNCLSGICRSCITRVLSGIVEHDRERVPYLNIDPVEIAQGYRLLCSAFARTNVELDR